MIAEASTAADVPRLERFSEILELRTQFDPARPMQLRRGFDRPAGAPTPWWMEYDLPLVLIETRIAPGKKLNGPPTAEQRTAFGRELLLAMAEAVE